MNKLFLALRDNQDSHSDESESSPANEEGDKSPFQFDESNSNQQETLKSATVNYDRQSMDDIPDFLKSKFGGPNEPDYGSQQSNANAPFDFMDNPGPNTKQASSRTDIHSSLNNKHSMEENTNNNEEEIKTKMAKGTLNDEEAEAAKEDKMAEALIKSKDKFRMDDQPEILGVNNNGISAAADKASISASVSNGLTQNMNQDSRVGVDTSNPSLMEAFGKQKNHIESFHDGKSF